MIKISPLNKSKAHTHKSNTNIIVHKPIPRPSLLSSQNYHSKILQFKTNLAASKIWKSVKANSETSIPNYLKTNLVKVKFISWLLFYPTISPPFLLKTFS